MKKILIIIALLAGILIPLFTQAREFYYISLLLIFALLFFSIKKKPLTLMDVLILFLITIPLHTFRFGGQEHFIRLSEIVFLPLSALWIISKFFNKSGEPLMIRKEFFLLLLYLIINVISTKNSIYPQISIKRTVILAYLFLFTYMVYDIVNSKERMGKVIKAMILISAISSIIAFLQCVFPRLLMFGRVPIGKIFGIIFYRAGVGWHDPNYYALYLGMNAALTLCYMLSYGEKYRFLKICFLLQVIGIFTTFSRTISISLILVSLYILHYFGKKRMAFIIFLSILIGVVIISSSMLIIYKKYPFAASVIFRIADKEKIIKHPSLIIGHRADAFKANWSMFLDHPLLGVGPFMAMYNYQKYKPLDYLWPLEVHASHNQYLQLLAEKGILGFIVFMGFILLIIKNINISIKNIPDSEFKSYLIGLKSAIFIYLIASLLLETSYELQFWLTMGLSMGLLNILKKDAQA